MNSLRKLMILQLREWLRILENNNIQDGEAFDSAPDLFELNQRYNHNLWHELRAINKKLDSLNTNGNRFVCQLQQNDSLSHFISSVANYKEAVKDFRSWLIGTRSLIIVDPYFFSFNKTKQFRTESNYTDELLKILPNNLNEVEVFHLPGPNKRIHERFQNYCRKNEIRFRNYSTNEIHDRVWIKNKEDGKVVGTSFGGLGNKIAFILDLPDEDRNLFMQELHRIKNQVLPPAT